MRSKKTTTVKPPQPLRAAKNMRAAVSITGLPMHAIKRARDAACPAFKANGTINCEELVDFIAHQPPTLGVDYLTERALDIRAARRLKEQRFEERAKILRSATEVRAAVFRNVVACKMKLYAAEGEIHAEAVLRGLGTEQAALVRELVAKHQRLAIAELHAGDLGKVTCPNCSAEIKPQK